jgi:DNA-binding MarR family transcriptional regulator
VDARDETADESRIRLRAPTHRPALHRKHGHYPAFIYTYSYMFRRPPAEADMQRYFRVSPPSVHQMVLTLERNGVIRRQPGAARRIELLVPPRQLPILQWLQIDRSLF